MFDGILSPDLNIYAVVSADAGQSSWGTYCYPYDRVRDEHMLTCLADLFSVSWMQLAKHKTTPSYTLDDHFEEVRSLVNKSTVRRFGDLSIGKDPISNFFGNPTQILQREADFTKLLYISSQDQDLAKLFYLYNRLIKSKQGLFSLSQEDLYLKNELDHRIHTDHLFSKIAHAFKVSDKFPEEAPTHVTKFSCLRQMIRDFTLYCKHG